MSDKYEIIAQNCLALAIDRCETAGLPLKVKRQRMIIKGAIRQMLEEERLVERLEAAEALATTRLVLLWNIEDAINNPDTSDEEKWQSIRWWLEEHRELTLATGEDEDTLVAQAEIRRRLEVTETLAEALKTFTRHSYLFGGTDDYWYCKLCNNEAKGSPYQIAHAHTCPIGKGLAALDELEATDGN